jgi:hypothetical protein
MSVVTVEKVMDEIAALLRHPTFTSVPKSLRLSRIVFWEGYYAEELSFTGHPHLVDSFPLQVQAGLTEYPVPAEDFGGLHYVVADPDFYPNESVREVSIINWSNSNMGPGMGDSHGGQRVAEIAVRGSGEDLRLITFPSGANDYLKVWYSQVPANEKLSADSVLSLEGFQLRLIPLAVACDLLKYCSWPGGSDLKPVLGNMGDPTSLPNLLARVEDQFQRKAWRPNKAQPTAKRQGFMARTDGRRLF